MAADRARLSHVDQRVGNAAGAKQRNHTIGDVTLPGSPPVSSPCRPSGLRSEQE
jgi:hypothetical protein